MRKSPLLAGFLVVASLIAMGMSVWTQIDQAEDQRKRDAYEACSTRALNDLIVVLTDTRQVAADERAIQRRMYVDIARRPASFQARLGQYVSELDAADAERSRRPLPAPPLVACGSAR